MTGKKILDARQQGKYFWLVMDSPPHPLMHFGMSGWMKFSNDDSAYHKPTKPEEAVWPPRFWKFALQMKEEPKNEVAFVDGRRLGRIRLVDATAEDMRTTSPLKENGPDPIIDKDILTVDWLGKKLRSKRVPVKALLLDQANISGIGNWVGDEVMFQARLHPEQYSNTFSDEQIKKLHEAIMYVCDTAVEANAESDKFPPDWLMKYRWDKGKNKESKLPTGEKIVFLKVGGRTSAIVPSLQKKTAAVAGDVSDGAEGEAAEAKSKRGMKRKAAVKETSEDEDDQVQDVKPKRGGKRKATVVKEASEAKDDEEEELKPKRGGKRKAVAVAEEDGEVAVKAPAMPKRGRKKVEEKVKEESDEDDDAEVEEAPPPKKQKKAVNGAVKKGKKADDGETKTKDTGGRRRSGRLST
jgi:formamidopyrimidine-DNA glycosylase